MGRPKASTLADMGPSYDQSAQFQKLADVPDEVFEARLADPYGVPSTAEIITLGEEPPRATAGRLMASVDPQVRPPRTPVLGLL